MAEMARERITATLGDTELKPFSPWSAIGDSSHVYLKTYLILKICGSLNGYQLTKIQTSRNKVTPMFNLTPLWRLTSVTLHRASRWLNCEGTNISKTISLLVITNNEVSSEFLP
jgi:hypothetical protein